MGAKIGFGSGVTELTGDVAGNAKVALPDATTPARVGAIRMFSENDSGGATGTPYLVSPETDADYRLRIANEALFDCETFNYTAQNTGKFNYRNTTMTNAWSAAGLTTNSGNITTITTGTQFSTYAEFPLLGANQLYCEIEGSFNAQPTTNTIIDFGMCRLATTNPYAPADGI
jgi:hypothetical protein